jgi:hypothetical protein
MAEWGIARLVRLLADMSCNVAAWYLSGAGGIGVSDMLLGIRLLAARRTETLPHPAETNEGSST